MNVVWQDATGDVRLMVGGMDVGLHERGSPVLRRRVPRRGRGDVLDDADALLVASDVLELDAAGDRGEHGVVRPRPVPGPAMNVMPRWRTMIEPALTSWPSPPLDAQPLADRCRGRSWSWSLPSCGPRCYSSFPVWSAAASVPVSTASVTSASASAAAVALGLLLRAGFGRGRGRYGRQRQQRRRPACPRVPASAAALSAAAFAAASAAACSCLSTLACSLAALRPAQAMSAMRSSVRSARAPLLDAGSAPWACT